MGIVFLIPFFACFLLFAVGYAIIATATISQSGKLSLGRRIALWCKLLGVGVFIVCSLLWLVGAAIQDWSGGSTDGGRIDGGRYYLVSHGHYTEVSKEEWDFVGKTESLFGFRCWLIGALGMGTFFCIGLLEKRRLVTNLADGLDLPNAQQ